MYPNVYLPKNTESHRRTSIGLELASSIPEEPVVYGSFGIDSYTETHCRPPLRIGHYMVEWWSHSHHEFPRTRLLGGEKILRKDRSTITKHKSISLACQ